MGGTNYIPADELWPDRLRLHLNGMSYHFQADRNEVNEINYGFGFSYRLGRFRSDNWLLDRSRLSIEGEAYSDSFSELAGAAGVAFQRPLWRFLDFGLRLGLIYERNIEEKVGFPIVPYALPFVETRFDTPVNARITLVPPVSKATGGFIALQVIVRL